MKCDRYVAYDRHNCKGAEHVKLRVKHFLTVASIYKQTHLLRFTIMDYGEKFVDCMTNNVVEYVRGGSEL